jgi:glutathione synthase/RimK-type ligase-like ATP-grasp enzyme
MSQTIIVIDDLSDWAHFYPSEQVITFSQYFKEQPCSVDQRTRVINLCNHSRYLSDGYYCSLLAEARRNHVIPSVRVLNDLAKRSLYRLHLEDVSETLEKTLRTHNHDDTIRLRTFFGNSIQTEYQELARRLFERFPCPILEITLRFRKHWEITGLKPRSHRELSDEEETAFAESLNEFSRKIWRKKKTRKNFRYDMAILTNPDEKLPPSDKSALKKMIAAGNDLGIEVELITQADYMSLPEFDGLFIRETTAIDHHTYRFAKRAESENIVVIDDPTSILRCTNKVYLSELFRAHKVPTPRTHVLHKNNSQQITELENDIGYPIVIKIPDGSFSRGVVKVQNNAELQQHLSELFQKSSLLLAQEFLFTEFDWRIGILNRKPLFACRYYMVKNHWQIYRHGSNRTHSGGFETISVDMAPKPVLQAALNATLPIGNGLYGVDVKEVNNKGYVIEVNDNPNIDGGVEDKYLGKELYRALMVEFLRRMDLRRNTQ